MGKDEILNILSAHKAELKNFGVQSLYLFGSTARGDETVTSDIDLLVEFDPANEKIGIFALLRLRYYLEELLGKRIDLTTPNALKLPIKHRVLKEAIYAG